jgi:hypothetical protein
MEHPAGEAGDGALRLDFDRRLRLEFHGSRITSEAGLLAYRELHDALGRFDLAGTTLSECRRGKNTRHLRTGLFRLSVFGRPAGYEDVTDTDRLAHDPAMRAVVDRGGLDRRAVTWTRLSCGSFKANAVQLQLLALAYNLANFLRTLALPEEIKPWSLTTLRQRLVKIGAKIVRHGHCVIFQMAEVAVPRDMFQKILAAIAALRPLPSAQC